MWQRERNLHFTMVTPLAPLYLKIILFGYLMLSFFFSFLFFSFLFLGGSGLNTSPNGVEFQGKMVSVGAFPIGIDPEKFTEALENSKVQNRIATLEKKFQGMKLIVGVDRLDYIKGVPQKLHALEVFLNDHPEWIGKVCDEHTKFLKLN